MARYSRIRGPAANFETTSTFQTIPGFSVTRSFGRGVLLLFASFSLHNLTGITSDFDYRLLLDSVPTRTVPPRHTIASFATAQLALAELVPTTPGIHTLELQILGTVFSGDVVLADRGELIIIELPAWDQDSAIITL